jgi:hypothetical protein
MVDIESVKKKLAAGETVVCFTIVQGRSAMANVLRVNDDGTSEYEILGVCPRAPVLN